MKQEDHPSLAGDWFTPNKENKPQVNHKNGTKTDNKVENLEWASSSENVAHAWKTGLNINNKNYDKLNKERRMHSVEEVKNIRELYCKGKTVSEIVSLFNSNQGTIYKIVKNQTYKEVV